MSSISSAQPRPTMRGRRWVAPPPGMMPSFPSGVPNCAFAEATRRSHPSATSRPPPMQKPLTAAMVGLGVRSSRSARPWTMGSSAFRRSRCSTSARSEPVAKAFSPRSRDRDDADGLVLRRRRGGGVQIVQGSKGDGVEHLGTVDGDEGERPLDLVEDVFVGHHVPFPWDAKFLRGTPSTSLSLPPRAGQAQEPRGGPGGRSRPWNWSRCGLSSAACRRDTGRTGICSKSGWGLRSRPRLAVILKNPSTALGQPERSHGGEGGGPGAPRGLRLGRLREPLRPARDTSRRD